MAASETIYYCAASAFFIVDLLKGKRLVKRLLQGKFALQKEDPVGLLVKPQCGNMCAYAVTKRRFCVSLLI